MRRSAYYEELKDSARQVRQKYDIATPRVLRSDLRRIYKDQGIQIDYSPKPLRNLRGAYFHDELDGPSVLLSRGLPDDPAIFTLAHELKHHLHDKDSLIAYCDQSNQDDPLEIGAEVFAAELIYPEGDWVRWMAENEIGKGACTPEILVRMKRETRTTLSYAGLAKRADRLNFALGGSLRGIRWKKLEVQIYGEPFYKRLRQRPTPSR